MEAKRYKDSPKFEDLAGKALVASHERGGKIDLWVLCGTAEIGDDVLYNPNYG